MEIYYTTKIPTSQRGAVSAWSKATSSLPLLAVALPHNAVGIYTEEGRPLDATNEALIKNVRGSECACLAWHPTMPLLAVAWRDGAVSFWNAEEKHLEEDSKTHRTHITCMVWSNAGDRLVTADDSGKLAFWKTDRQLRPLPIVSFDETGKRVDHAIFGVPVIDEPNQTTSAVAYYTASAGGTSTIMMADDGGKRTAIIEVPEDVHKLIHYPERNMVVAITTTCNLMLLGYDLDLAEWKVAMRMKFSTGAGDTTAHVQVQWAGNHTLATASEREMVVRMFNFETEDNYVLTLNTEAAPAQRVCCLGYDGRYELLGVGTVDGRVVVFKHKLKITDVDSVDLAKSWEAEPSFQTGARPLSMEWGPTTRLMSVVGPDGVNVCRKSPLHFKVNDGIVALQTGVDRIIVEGVDNFNRTAGQLRNIPQILGLDVSKDHMLIWDGKKAEVYKLNSSGEVQLVSSFESGSRSMALQGDSIFRCIDKGIEVCNHQGTVKQTIAFDEAQGTPILLDVSGVFLAAITNSNYMRVFKLTGREAKPHSGPDLLQAGEEDEPLGPVSSIRLNCNGTMVSVLMNNPITGRDLRVLVYCTDTAKTMVYDFTKDQRIPQAHMWDISEPKLLLLQMVQVASDDVLDEGVRNPGDVPRPDAALMFASPDYGILLQEYQRLDMAGSTMVGVIGAAVPHLILYKKPSIALPSHAAPAAASNVHKVLMQNFQGMYDIDDKTRKALLDFSFHLAVNNMDEAFRAVKTIKNPAVWQNMAHMAIKNKRLDVAEHCLGNMEHARGARAVRESHAIDELDARVASVAIHLGMIDDAKRLYATCQRYDLLNALYRACGQWEKALEVAVKYDRIHLKATHHHYAQHLERVKDYKNAIVNYEKSNTHRFEVPRMLYEAGRLDELEKYAMKGGDKELVAWWARYCESNGDFAKAAQCYQLAEDHLALVRIHCFNGDFSAAENVALTSQDAAAAFHLGRHYEALEKPSEAVRFYTLAKRFSHGVRLAKKFELDSELMQLALKSSKAVMVDTADYLAEKGLHDKAATLYMKGGRLKKAVDMCFNAELFDVLQQVADEVDGTSDPALIERCAEFFLMHEQFEKAAKMMVHGHNVEMINRALDICIEHEVVITEDMAELMTPEKTDLSADDRNALLKRIAKACKRQGSYHLACKKYTQAGDKIKATKALIKSGDTEKIVFFANVSRNRDIFLMAANYLQTLDWHSNGEVMNNIIGFYKKANAMENLSSFYEACAQIEIDEYRDYEKGLAAMREAQKYIAKSKGPERDQRLGGLDHRIQLTEKFVQARQAIGVSPHDAMQLCSDLLREVPDGQDVEIGIRVGDVYALMVEYYYEQGNMQPAYQLIEDMKARRIILSPYLDQTMVDAIYKAVGAQQEEDYAGGYNHRQADEDQDPNDFVEENIAEDDT